MTAGLARALGNRRARGHDVAALSAWLADPADGLRLARPTLGMAAVRPGRPRQAGGLARYRPGERVLSLRSEGADKIGCGRPAGD